METTEQEYYYYCQYTAPFYAAGLLPPMSFGEYVSK